MSPFIPDHSAVWFEIPVSDMGRARAFYGAVLQNELTDMEGSVPMARFAASDPEKSVAGHLYPGKPPQEGTGITIHLAVSGPLEEAMERVSVNGGRIVSDIISIPAGRFVYCLDPGGNSFGIFA